MKRLVACVLSVGIVGFITTGASAAPVIDQYQSSNPWHIGPFWLHDLAQSFQQLHDNVAGAGIFLHEGIDTSDLVTISLWDDLPPLGGNMLASQSALGYSGNWIDVFWSPVSVVPHSTLYLLFESANDLLGVSGDTQDPYPFGHAYSGSVYHPDPTFDFAFRTYYDDAVGVVPAPGALLLALIGTGAIGYLRRRGGEASGSSI